MLHHFLILLCTFAVAVAPLAAQPPSPPGPPLPSSVTVTVDCDSGDTLTEALETRARALVIEFTGTCTEDLLIERSQVTIRGLDDTAVLAGAQSLPPAASITVAGESLILQNFTISGSDERGIRLRRSAGIQLEGVHVDNSALIGLQLDDSSSARMLNSSFNDNGLFGIAAFGTSAVSVAGTNETNGNGLVGLLLSTGSGIENLGSLAFIASDNGLAGVVVQLNATGQFPPLTVQRNGFAGILCQGGRFFGVNHTITDNDVGIRIQLGGSVEANGLIEGNSSLAISADHRSQIAFNDSTIRGDVVLDGTLAEVERTTLDGDLILSFGTRATLRDLTLLGTIQCDDSVVVRGTPCPASLQPDAFSGDLRESSDHVRSPVHLFESPE